MLTLVAAVNLSRINPTMLAAQRSQIYYFVSSARKRCSLADARQSDALEQSVHEIFSFLIYIKESRERERGERGKTPPADSRFTLTNFTSCFSNIVKSAKIKIFFGSPKNGSEKHRNPDNFLKQRFDRSCFIFLSWIYV